MNRSFSALERAVSKSFDKAASTDTHQIKDEDLKLYESLTPEAFNAIAEIYGPDGLVQYVTAMEVRRSKTTGE